MKILLFGLGLIGCSEEKTDETEEIQEVEGVVYEYYDAYSLITLEHSGMQFEETYIVRRGLNLDDSQIYEEFYSTIDGTLITLTLDVDVAAKSFVLSFSDDSYTGEGSFEGEGLDWTSWESHSNHTDGTFVISEDSKDADGIHTYKVGYDMGGDPEWTMNEELTPLTKEEWDQLFTELPEAE